MNNWWNDAKKILKWVLYLLIGLMLLFILNQLLALFQFFSQIHLYLAITIVAIVLMLIVFVLYRLVSAWRKQPQALELPEDPSSQAYHDYLHAMKDQLQKNPHLSAFDFNQKELPLSMLVDKVILELQEKSLPLIKENANAIFLSTAISQNGALDSLVVLFTLLRMVWQLSMMYGTRPSLRGMIRLYIEVVGVVLMARSLEDMDLIEGQMEPIITSLIGESIISAIPGMVPITNLVVSSLMEGAVNAFLTLRVGMITQKYLGMVSLEDKQAIRRSASLKSIGYMGTILTTNGKVVIKAMPNTVKNAGKGVTKKWFFEKG